MAAGDTAAVFTAIAKAKARCHLAADAPVCSCNEAGRDGFWLHRCLEEHRITNLTVDSVSIEVNRRRRCAKTDRLDSDRLPSALMRYYGGERRVWTVARILLVNRTMSGEYTADSVVCARRVLKRTGNLGDGSARVMLPSAPQRVAHSNGLLLRRWDVADRFKRALVVEPVHPFDGLPIAPRATADE